MGLSEDPDVRAKQLSNLRPGAGASSPGEQRALRHGLRSGSPLRHLDNAQVTEMREAILGAIPLAPGQSEPSAGDRLQAEALAVQGVVVLRVAAYFGSHPEEGLAALGLWSLTTDRFSRGLERLGIGAAARAKLGLDTARTLDLAAHWAQDDEDIPPAAVDGTALEESGAGG